MSQRFHTLLGGAAFQPAADASERAPALATEMMKHHHYVPCPRCRVEFDLFAAVWCAHLAAEPSKICPACRQCLCDHPAYEEPNFWKDAPPAFQQRGFQRLFLYYL